MLDSQFNSHDFVYLWYFIFQISNKEFEEEFGQSGEESD